MINELFSMEDKICVVTGGSRGLGYFMAKGFLGAGAKRVYITARGTEACEKAAAELAEYGECIALPGDISSLEEINSLANTIRQREKSLDVLVNNAGCAWGAPLQDLPEHGWDKVMDLNVKTPFFLSRELVPLLAEGASAANTASIINIGSIAGIGGTSPDTFSYSTSKAAIHQLTRNLAVELADKNIRVNAIAPGRFLTAMTAYADEDTEFKEKEIATIPLHRWGEESDLAGVAIMLASQAGAYITGQIIPVCGGYSLRTIEKT